jgi:hypothetical protein
LNIDSQNAPYHIGTETWPSHGTGSFSLEIKPIILNGIWQVNASRENEGRTGITIEIKHPARHLTEAFMKDHEYLPSLLLVQLDGLWLSLEHSFSM